MFIELSPLN